MKKLSLLTLIAVIFSYASFAQLGPLSPASGSICMGNYLLVMDSTHPGGVWTSSNVAVATVGSSTGIITPVSAGVVTMTYTLSGSFITGTYTVNPTPAAITGGSGPICMGATLALSDATLGGVWSSSAPSIATVGSATGVVTGVSSGIATIMYTLGSCSVIDNVTISGAGPVMPISGAATVCVGSTITLTDLTSGGTWSSSAPGIATVSSSGVVTGIAVGGVYISYTLTSSCGSTTVTHFDSVTATSTPGAISGTTTVGVGAHTYLYDATPGGTWTSSSTSTATITSGGYVTGVAAGTCTITYTVTGACGTGFVTTTVTVSPLDQITGNINFTSTPPDSSDVLKIWLITYNSSTSMLAAVDSITTHPYASTVPYTFNSPAADSYRVKAAVYHTPFSSTGYQPTYHLSSYYWSTASVFWHATGTVDASKDINMMYGTVTAGVGFIAGNVTTGANKGTSGGTPAVGLLVYAVDASGAPVQHTYTDASGNYSFSNLALGTYTIFPEALNYRTTAFTSITLTASAASMSVADFTQHTMSHTITPHTTATPNIKSVVSSVIAFPNPTNGKLFVQWTVKAAEQGTVTISDVTGRVVMTNAIDMNQGTGSQQLDLSGLANGTYVINIKSASLDYNNKIVVTH